MRDTFSGRDALRVTVLALTLAPALALAHAGDSTTAGLLAGLAHPWTGVDHLAVAAVVVFGVLAVGMGHARVLSAAALIAVFTFFQGYVHAVEMPRQFSQLGFTMGFLISMLTLQLSGVLLASALLRVVTLVRSHDVRELDMNMKNLAWLGALSLAVSGAALAGDAAAGKAKAEATCAECHEKADWADQDAASLQAKIKGVVDGKTKHQKKLTLTEQEAADIAAYWAEK